MSLFVVAPAILTFWNRSIPFEYIEVSFTQAAAYPGDEVTLRFVTGRVRTLARGEFDRIFYDGDGRATFLGTMPTVYDKLVEVGKTGVFYKRIRIPRDAQPGEGVYVTRPRFWHNPVQGYLLPVEAPPQKARIRVLPQPAQIDVGRPAGSSDEGALGPR